MARRCGSTETEDGHPCRHRVKTGRCHEHTCWKLFLRRRRQARSARRRAPETDDVERIAREVTGPRWRRTVTARALRTVPREDWLRFTASDAARTCTTLARIARNVGASEGALRSLITSLVPTSSAPAKIVAQAVARGVVATAGVDSTLVATSIRVLGILACAQAGRDLSQCPCLLDMAGHRNLKKTLRDALIELE